jgi:hypothetical protein
VVVPIPCDPKNVADEKEPEAPFAPFFYLRTDESGGQGGDNHGRPLKKIEPLHEKGSREKAPERASCGHPSIGSVAN